MSKNNQDKNSVIVGLSLQKDETSLVKDAVYLAEKMGAQLVLCHVRRPFQDYAMMGEYVMYPIDLYGPTLDEIDETCALAKLEAIRKDHPTAKIEVRSNTPCDGLLEAAKNHKASMLIVGTDLKEGIFSGFSTSLSLMRKSDIPVMVLPNNDKQWFSGNISIFFADNLKKECINALSYTYKFSEKLDLEDFIHFHIKETSQDEMDRIVEQMKTALLLKHSSENLDLNYKEKVTEYTLDLINQRQEALKVPTEQTKNHVLFGKSEEAIPQLISQFSSSKLIVFGSHHIFHRDSFSFGKLPYSSMLKFNAAVLVVPESHKD